MLDRTRIYDRTRRAAGPVLRGSTFGHSLVGPRWPFELVRSSPPRQIPSARAPNTSDVRTTLSVCVESAILAATAVLGTPPALSSSTALRKYHGGDTEDGRDNERSKHDFISVWSWVYRSATTPRSSTHLAGWQAFCWLVEVSNPLRMACGRTVAATVVRCAQMRAAF